MQGKVDALLEATRESWKNFQRWWYLCAVEKNRACKRLINIADCAVAAYSVDTISKPAVAHIYSQTAAAQKQLPNGSEHDVLTLLSHEIVVITVHSPVEQVCSHVSEST